MTCCQIINKCHQNINKTENKLKELQSSKYFKQTTQQTSTMSRNNAFQASTSYMSDIKQSIQEYSMNFQNSQQAISELISASRTGLKAQISRTSKNPAKKSLVRIAEKQVQKAAFARKSQLIIQEAVEKQNTGYTKQNTTQNKNGSTQAIFLGDTVFNVVKQRFREAQGSQTSNPDTLFEFYKRQRKMYNPHKSTIKNVTLNDVGVLMPSSQRRILLKMEFEKVLTYYPHDVYYTLACGAEKEKKDLELDKKVNRLNHELGQRPHSQRKKNTKQVVDRLYPNPPPKRSASVSKDFSSTKDKQAQIQKQKRMQLQQKQKRRKFCTKLRQSYQTYYRKAPQPPVETYEKLSKFWQGYEHRGQEQLEWTEQTVKEDIRLFMMEQVEDLLYFLQKKLGFKELKLPDLRKFYLQHMPIQGIDIPVNSFKEYVFAFNQVMQQKQNQQSQKTQKMVDRQAKRQKQSELKKFGRPVSATPISILSKPKTTANFGDLMNKYSKDQFLSTILHQDKMKVARHAFQYGVHNLQEQVKIKGRVKPVQNQNFQKTIFKMLNSTFTNKNFFNVKDVDRVRDILGQDDVQKAQTWKQLGPVLQQAMLVKCYQQSWFREALVKYCSRAINKDFKYQDDKSVVQELFRHFDNLSEYHRKTQISNLENVINASQTIAERTRQIAQLGKKGQNYQLKQKRLFYSFLQQRACEFVELRIKRQQVNIRKFLNEIFQTSIKDHKQFVTKHFHVVTGQKDCPKLLKYQFFRLQKQINPFTKQRDQKSKCHAWIPTKTDPDIFNYKTFNTYSNIYNVDKNKILSQPQDQKYRNSIWSYKKQKAKQRQALLMSYQDAKQCVFHPKISRPQ